jgi:hypothetical protein
VGTGHRDGNDIKCWTDDRQVQVTPHHQAQRSAAHRHDLTVTGQVLVQS